jgi:hypothetical protein
MFILSLTFERGKSSNFIQTNTEYMRKLIPLSFLSFTMFLCSCATYRNGQTPDDVYMAAEPEWARVNDRYRADDNRDLYSENRTVHTQTGNRPTRNLYNFYCDDPRRLIVFNDQCYCLTNGSAIPFVPAKPIRNLPTIQSNPSVLSKDPVPQNIQYGKFSVPVYNNGSRIFPKASNDNNTQRATSDNNGGSRYFQSNTPSNSSGSSNTGSGSRSGRRN